MFRNYFILSLRNFVRDKSASLINLFGLAVGMACFLLILTYVRFEASYDRFHEKADRIYRVVQEDKKLGRRLVGTPEPLVAAVTAEIPGVVGSTSVFLGTSKDAILQAGEKMFYHPGYCVDAAFLEFFSFPLLRGDRGNALSSPSSIVLAESAARRLFGNEDPMGKSIDWKQSDKKIALTVTGILKDIPENSHLRFDFLASREMLRSDPAFRNNFNNWNSHVFASYIELEKGRTPESVEGLLPSLLSKLSAPGDANPADGRYFLQPLTDIHLKSGLFWGSSPGGEIQVVRLFLAVAFLILLIACVNHVNLATARSASRSREIGIRKTAGACRTQIFEQFLGESFFIAGLAGVLAVGLLAIVLPWFESLVGLPLRSGWLGLGGVWPWLAATVVFVGFSAGLYPAFVLSGLPPVRTLRELTATGRKGALLRGLMVVFQYTSAVVLIIATAVVSGQMKHVRSMRLGYDRENVVVLPIRDGETRGKMEALKAAFEQRPEVLKCSLTDGIPTKLGMYLGGAMIEADSTEKAKHDFRAYRADENFLDVFGIELAAGRNFSGRNAGENDAVLLNETAVREIGWKEAPVGRTIKIGGAGHLLAGIVKDFHSGSLHDPIKPLIIFAGKGETNIAVRLGPGELTRMISVLGDIFKKNGSGQPFDFYFLDDAFNALYLKEIRTGKIFGAFASLAVLIAGLGLFGLTAFNVAARTKEIGIRKVLGASVSRICLLLNKDLLRCVLIANLIAWPLAYYFMSGWLREFASRIPASPWIFLLSSALSLAVALLVVGGQTVRAARANPVQSLRTE